MKTLRPVLALAVLVLGTCGTAKAQVPILGQPYQVPVGYEGYAAGTLVAYSGYNYVIQGDGTMQVSSATASCTQSSCSQQPAAFYPTVVQPTATYFYQPTYYRHHSSCHYRSAASYVSWYGGCSSRGRCHHR